jgi:hypothetical protein
MELGELALAFYLQNAVRSGSFPTKPRACLVGRPPNHVRAVGVPAAENKLKFLAFCAAALDL